MGLALLTGEVAPGVKVSTPVGDTIWVIWVFLSAGGSRLHGSPRVLSLLLHHPVVGSSALRALSKWEVGRLVSARSELMFSERGDLEILVDCCACFGVIVVLVGFSLEIVACVVIPIVEKYWYGSTCNVVSSRSMMRKDKSTPLSLG